MLKAVIFDMDGVLIDSEPYYIYGLHQVLLNLGIPNEEKDLYEIAGGNSAHYDKVIHRYIDPYNISMDKYHEENDKFFSENKTPYAKLINNNTIKVLETLKNKGYKLALASSSYFKEIRTVLDTLDLNQYFDYIISGELFKESKPNPEIYNTCVKELNLTKDECIAIEDSEYGITAAKRAGLTCIAKIDNRFGFNQELADYKINDLIEILDIVEGIK